MLWWVPWCFLRGSGTRGKGQGPVSLPQWRGGASGAGGGNISREGRNALVGPLVLLAWKWNEGEGVGSGLPPSVGRRRQWGRWREHFKGGTECAGGSLGASCVEVEPGGRGRVRSPSLSGEAAPVGQVAREYFKGGTECSGGSLGASLRGNGMRGKGQGAVSLPQWGGGASGAGGENTLREGRNALVGPLVLPAWKW